MAKQRAGIPRGLMLLRIQPDGRDIIPNAQPGHAGGAGHEQRSDARPQRGDLGGKIGERRPGCQLRQQRLDRILRRRAIGKPDARQHPQCHDRDQAGCEEQARLTRDARPVRMNPIHVQVSAAIVPSAYDGKHPVRGG